MATLKGGGESQDFKIAIKFSEMRNFIAGNNKERLWELGSVKSLKGVGIRVNGSFISSVGKRNLSQMGEYNLTESITWPTQPFPNQREIRRRWNGRGGVVNSWQITNNLSGIKSVCLSEGNYKEKMLNGRRKLEYNLFLYKYSSSAHTEQFSNHKDSTKLWETKIWNKWMREREKVGDAF